MCPCWKAYMPRECRHTRNCMRAGGIIIIIIHNYEYNYLQSQRAMKTTKTTRETIDNIVEK